MLYAGVKDATYPLMLLKPMVERLRAAGYQIDLREKDMNHCLDGRLGGKLNANIAEEYWIKKFLEERYQEASLGSLMKAPSAAPVAPLDAKDLEAAVKVVYSILFGNKLPHGRNAEIMKYSCWEASMSDLTKRINKLSADDLTLVARFFGAESVRTPDLARFLATPNATRAVYST